MKTEHPHYDTKVELYYDNSIPGVGPWWVQEEIKYYSKVADMEIVVPAGFPTDLATVPKIPVIYEVFRDEAVKASIIHDYLYLSKIVSRKMADDIFREAGFASNVTTWKMQMMWAAVRVFGPLYY